MAKSDSFFIRHSIEPDNTGNFVQDSIDLGAYVDALGKSVLRIHNIAVTMSDSFGNAAQVQASVDSAAIQFQLTTSLRATPSPQPIARSLRPASSTLRTRSGPTSSLCSLTTWTTFRNSGRTAS